MNHPPQPNDPLRRRDPAASLSRREALRCMGGGFGYLAFTHLLAEGAPSVARPAEGPQQSSPLASKSPHLSRWQGVSGASSPRVSRSLRRCSAPSTGALATTA